MNDLLIHIGYHKTATTWLQSELFGKKSNIFHHLSDRERGQSNLAFDFFSGKDGYLLSPFDNNKTVIDREFQRIMNSASGLENKVPVISNERLSGNPHSGGYDASIILERIHNCFPSAKILIIIREQKSWILSNYFQYLTVGGNHSLDKYLNRTYDNKRPGFSPHSLDYHYLIEKYKSNFGNENVLVLPYEMLRSSNQLFFERIGKLVNKDIDLENLNFDAEYNTAKNQYVNYKLRSLNPFIRPSSMNNHFRYSNPTTKFFAKSTKRLLNKMIPQRLNDQIIKQLEMDIENWSQARFEKSNELTSKLIETDLRGFGYTMPN